MNTRISISVALALGGVVGLVLAPAMPRVQAQAPGVSSPQNLEAKIERMQSQIDALQAQVKKLQADMRAASPRTAIGPLYTVPNFQSPGSQSFGFQSPSSPSFGFQMPGSGSLNIQPPFKRYSNIPPCQVTLLTLAPR